MKKLLLIAVVAAIPVMAQAAISVDEMTNPTAVQNNGFSKQVAETITINKARANNQEYL